VEVSVVRGTTVGLLAAASAAEPDLGWTRTVVLELQAVIDSP